MAHFLAYKMCCYGCEGLQVCCTSCFSWGCGYCYCKLLLFIFFFKAICFLNWKTHNRTHSGETEWNSSNVSASSIHTAANESVWRVWNWEPSSRAASPGRTGLLLALEPVPPVDRAQLITKQLLQSTTKCIKILRYVLASFNIILEELLLRLECL